jgi:phage shock protein A
MRSADKALGQVAVSGRPFRHTSMSEATLRELALEMERAAFELRRETVAAVTQQQLLREEAFAARRLADAVEGRASRAFAKGDSLLARQILARDMYILKTCEALEDGLTLANRSVAELLRRLMQTEDQARWAWRRKEELAEKGRGC